jgi:hypothetical protein
MSQRNGFEYEKVGECPKSGKPILAPIAWNSKDPRPQYVACDICRSGKKHKK